MSFLSEAAVGSKLLEVPCTEMIHMQRHRSQNSPNPIRACILLPSLRPSFLPLSPRLCPVTFVSVQFTASLSVSSHQEMKTEMNTSVYLCPLLSVEGHTHEYPELDVLSILQQKQHF